MTDYLLLQKAVDMSLLNEGMSIPVTFHEIFHQKLGFRIPKGETCPIKVLIGNDIFDVLLKNYDFDEKKATNCCWGDGYAGTTVSVF